MSQGIFYKDRAWLRYGQKRVYLVNLGQFEDEPPWTACRFNVLEWENTKRNFKRALRAGTACY